MLVIAHHDIQDPEKFWAAAKAMVLPSHLKVHSVFPSADMNTGTCVWEAPSANDVQKFLDETAGSFSKNTCYEVNTDAAIGAPALTMEAVA